MDQVSALQLFNEAGTAAVSTNHVAEAMGMSPGNLYYHFRNKDAIIGAICERLFADWDTQLSLPADRPPTLDDPQNLVTTIFTILWQYRFVYRELVALLRHDPVLHARFLAVRQRGMADFHALFAHFAAAGVLRSPDDPAAIVYLADLCWLISEFWLPSVELSGQTFDPETLSHGTALMRQVLQPFIQTENREDQP